MAKILIIHGTYGYPTENWIPWLRAELEQRGHEVISPQFPTPENQNLTAWLQVFEQYRELCDDDMILVGHSVGASFILSVLETLSQPVKASFLVAGFASMLPNAGNVGLLIKTFVEKEFNWPTIRQNSRSFTIFQSDNDPYVPVDKAGELAQQLNTPITYVANAGHFNETADYLKFPLLLERILTEIS